MLSYEWRELEKVCDRIGALRERYTAAQRVKNTGLIEGLKADIAQAKRDRERLVLHISARLASTTPHPESRRDAVPANAADTIGFDDEDI